MKNENLFDNMKDFFATLVGRRISYGEAVILRTALMLAALDGEVSDDEVQRFKKFAETCRGYNDKSFEKLWEDAIRSAGYLYLQSRFLSKEELVAAFVEEARGGFIDEVAWETSEDRDEAFKVLEEMAKADGDYSEIEREAISALNAAVKSEREKALGDRYTRVSIYDK